MRWCARCRRRLYDESAAFCPFDGTRLEVPDDRSGASDPHLGTVLQDQFQLTQAIGSGAMGTVYRAWQRGMEREVAVKVLRADLMADPELRRRFLREGRTSARLDHPNIVSVFMVGETCAGAPYLVMEHLGGETLEQVLEREGRFPPARAADVARQIAAGLAEAHAAGVVHRDLKPGNVVLLERRGTGELVKIFDFGIAKLADRALDADGGSRLTRDGAIFGTPDYMAPEQAQGAAVDGRADLYSLGVLLYRMLAGRLPFDGNAVSVILAHIGRAPPDLATVAPDVPAELAAVVMRCLAKDPANRPATAERFLDALALAMRPADRRPPGASFSPRAQAMARAASPDPAWAQRAAAARPPSARPPIEPNGTTRAADDPVPPASGPREPRRPARPIELMREPGGPREPRRPARPIESLREPGGPLEPRRPARPIESLREPGGPLEPRRPARPIESQREPGGPREPRRPARPIESQREPGGPREPRRPARPIESQREPGGPLEPRRPARPSEPMHEPGGPLEPRRPARPSEPMHEPGGPLEPLGPVRRIEPLRPASGQMELLGAARRIEPRRPAPPVEALHPARGSSASPRPVRVVEAIGFVAESGLAAAARAAGPWSPSRTWLRAEAGRARSGERGRRAVRGLVASVGVALLCAGAGTGAGALLRHAELGSPARAAEPVASTASPAGRAAASMTPAASARPGAVVLGERRYAVRALLPEMLVAGRPVELLFDLWDHAGQPLEVPAVPVTLSSLAPPRSSAEADEPEQALAARPIPGEPGRYRVAARFASPGPAAALLELPDESSLHVHFDVGPAPR